MRFPPPAHAGVIVVRIAARLGPGVDLIGGRLDRYGVAPQPLLGALEARVEGERLRGEALELARREANLLEIRIGRMLP